MQNCGCEHYSLLNSELLYYRRRLFARIRLQLHPVDNYMAAVDLNWVFDTALAFLHSPFWTLPVLSFIDEYCLYFDDNDEEKLIYTEIHQVCRFPFPNSLKTTQGIQEVG